MLSRINGGSFADRKSVHIIITRVWEKFHIRVFMISAYPRTLPEEICGREADGNLFPVTGTGREICGTLL